MKLQILTTLVAEQNNGSNFSYIQMFLNLTPLELSGRLYIGKIIKLLLLVLKIVISLKSISTFELVLLSVDKNAKE